MKRNGFVWLILLVVAGLALGITIQRSILAATHMVPVWVAVRDIPVDQMIQEQDLKRELRPQSAVPASAIKDPNEAAGKYTAITILAGQVVEQAAVADASTMREVVRRYGLDFVGMALQVDSNDLPLDQVKAGDIVAIIGTFMEGPQNVRTSLIAAEVPVIAVVPAEKKLMIAVPRESALELARDKALGKISVVLDPKPFQKNVVMPDMSITSEPTPPTAPVQPASTQEPKTTEQQQQQAQ